MRIAQLSTVAASVALLLAASAMAGQLGAWRKPDGTVYVGERPPPGAEPIHVVESSQPAPDDDPVDEATGDASFVDPDDDYADEIHDQVERLRERKRDMRWARGACAPFIDVEDRRNVTYRSIGRIEVKGTARNRSRRTIRDVEICALDPDAGEVCTTLDGTLEPGTAKPFRIANLPAARNAKQIPLSISCAEAAP